MGEVQKMIEDSGIGLAWEWGGVGMLGEELANSIYREVMDTDRDNDATIEICFDRVSRYGIHGAIQILWLQRRQRGRVSLIT